MAANHTPAIDGARGARPLRVCHLAYTFYETDNRVMRYAEALAERGDEVDVIALRRPGQPDLETVEGVRVHRVQRRSVTEKRAWVYLLKLLWFCVKSGVILSVLHSRKRYDVVHVHNVPDFLVFAAIVPRLTGARLILDIHDILPELYAGKFGAERNSAVFRALLFVERLSCRFSDHVIVANHLWFDKLARRAVAADKCTAMLNYPDLRLFKPAPRRTDDRFVFIYPGTLNHHQGLDLAIEALALIRDRVPAAELHIYGEGPERTRLEDLVKTRSLTSRVIIKDRVPLREVAAVMAAADVGLVPKRSDGFGNEAFSTKTFEFMASGVPVIVARTEVDAHYFDETLVRFFIPGSARSLADVMLEAYEQREKEGERIAAARDFAVANSWQARAGTYLHIVETLVSARRARVVAE